MFSQMFALFALMAVAFAAPSPKAAPEPQYIPYTGLDYVYPSGALVNPVVSPYAAAPVAYSALPAPYYLR